MLPEEVARIAVLAAVRYHRDKKDANGDVSNFYFNQKFFLQVFRYFTVFFCFFFLENF